MRRCFLLSCLLLTMLTLASCATIRRDRCYLAETRYMRMRAIFQQTNSFQRVAQAMEDEQWARCEVNSFRYRLRKDLGLEDEQFNALMADLEPAHEQLDFYPGTVERVP
jgi:hypothetical protein